MVEQGIGDGTFRGDIDPPEMLAMLMSIFSGTAVTGVDQIDAIARNTESWILSSKVKKQLNKQIGATK
jgi:hypothetical protein